MKIKIKYTADGTITRFVCLPAKLARQKQCAADELLIDASEVTPAFYNLWEEFMVIDGVVLPRLATDAI